MLEYKDDFFATLTIVTRKRSFSVSLRFSLITTRLICVSQKANSELYECFEYAVFKSEAQQPKRVYGRISRKTCNSVKNEHLNNLKDINVSV